MLRYKLIATGVAAVFASGAAWAQDAEPVGPADPAAQGAPAAPEDPAGPDASASPAAPPADQAQEETQIVIEPQDIDNFAKAALKIGEIEQDASMDATQKQNAKLAAVQESGLDPVKFNAIADASQSNPELQQRVQAAVVKEQEKQQAEAAGR